MRTMSKTRGRWLALLLFAWVLSIPSWVYADYDPTAFVTTWAGNGKEIVVPFQSASAQVRYYEKGTTPPSSWIPASPKQYSIDKNSPDCFRFQADANKTYVLEIKGQIQRIAMGTGGTNVNGSVDALLTIEQWGNSQFQSLNSAFSQCSNLIIPSTIKDKPDLSRCQDMSNAFRDCKKLTQVDPKGNWDVSKVEQMGQMFANSYLFDDANLSKWNVSKVKNFSQFLSQCSAFSGDLGSWDVSGCQNFSSMFRGCAEFTGHGLENWKVGRGIYFRAMFHSCLALNFNPAGWDISKTSDLSSMFYKCQKLGSGSVTVDFTAWAPRVKHVKDFSDMFRGCRYFTGKGVATWLMDKNNKAVNLSGMFAECEKFVEDLSLWKVDNVENMAALFDNCKSYNGKGLEKWNVSNVKDMSCMFRSNNNNKADLKDWDVSHVENMSYMFADCSDIKTDFSHWKTGACKNFRRMFSNCRSFNSKIDFWDVSQGVDFSGMLESCTSFNRDLSAWVLSKAQFTERMFAFCTSFNSDISYWDVSNVTNATGMFMGCRSFQKDLSKWSFKNLQEMEMMFRSATLFDSDLGRWDVSHVRKMDSAFAYATSFRGVGLDTWNVGECVGFSATFKECKNFSGDLSKWDMKSAEDLSFMFREASVGKTNFRTWDVSNVRDVEGLFYKAVGEIEDVSQWNTSSCANMKDVFTEAKGMEYALEWDLSALPANAEIGLDKCGMGVDAYNRTLAWWLSKASMSWKPRVMARDLYYSKQADHSSLASAGYDFVGDQYTNDNNLSLNANRMRLKVGEKKELRVEEKKGAIGITYVVTPTDPKRIEYHESENRVEGKIPGNAKVRVKSSNTTYPLHTFCAIEVYRPITALNFKKKEYDLAVGDFLDLRAEMTIEPEDVTYPERIKFEIDEATRAMNMPKKGYSPDNTSGLIKGLEAGEVKVTVTTFDAEGEPVKEEIRIHVKNVEAEKIQVVPSNILLGVNTKLTARVLFTPSNATNKKVTMTIQDPSTVVFSKDAMEKTEVQVDGVAGATLKGKKVGQTKLVAKTTTGQESTVLVTVVEHYVPVGRVRMLSQNLRIPVGTKTQLAVTVDPPLATNRALYFESENPEIAEVDESGIIKGVMEGKTRIKAMSVENTAIYQYCDVEVYINPVQEIQLVTEGEVVIGKGQSYKLRYKILPEDASNKSVQCTSADAETVSVEESTGVVTGVKEGGPVEITIKALGTTEEVEKKVQVRCVPPVATESLNLMLANVTLVPNEQRQMELQFTPTTTTDRDVDWHSNNEKVVTVDENGLLKAISSGEAQITVTLKSDLSVTASCRVTVRPHTVATSIELFPTKITLGQGDKYKLEAFAKPIYATQYELVWTVEDSEGVVAFDKDTQVVKGLKIGKATITVALKNDPSKTSSCEIIVISPAVATIGFDFEPAEFEIEHGGTLDLFNHIKFNPSAATDRYMDWESEKPSVVSVRGGRVTGLEATTEGVLITAKLHSDNSKVATCRVKVKQPTRPQNIKMLTSHLRIKVGDVRTLAVEFFPETSSERKLIWTSNNTTIATVDAMGTVTALEKGFTVVTAMLESDPRIMTVCTVEVVDPSTAGLVTSIAVEDVELMVGKIAELSVRYTPADAVDKTLIFTGVDKTKFRIEGSKVVGVAPTAEPVEVTAILATDPAITATFKVVVLPVVEVTSIRINHEKILIYELNEAYLRVVTTPENADQTGLTWTSDNESVCTVKDGLVLAVSEGIANVTATLNGKSASCEVTVKKQSAVLAADDAKWENLMVRPNPFSTTLRISNYDLQCDTKFELVDVMGKVVRSGRLLENETQIETTALTSGLYILRLETVEGQVKSIRVVKH